MEKKIDFSKKLYVLAPLAGYTDLPFRAIVKRFGADLTVSEMISSNGLVYNSSRTYKMLEKSNLENPYSVQISGSSSEIVKDAVQILNEKSGIDCIDLNCGCPVPKVVSSGSGSALLKDFNKLSKIVSTIKENSKKSYTSVKIRIGFKEKNGVEIAKICEESGADFIAVHGRTRKDKFGGEVDFDEIKKIKENISIPVIANGDITTYEKAKWVLDYTGTDGVMIGRGAVGNPWIFYQLKHGLQETPIDIKREIVLDHLNNMVKFYGGNGILIFRKHLHTYTKGHPNGTEFRKTINSILDEENLRNKIWEFFQEI